MRFPFSLTRSMTAYLLRKKLAGEKLFPLVLMLEPLHASNLSGAGGGRAGVRRYDPSPAVGRTMPGGGDRVRCADRESVWRRTVDLSRYRSAGREPGSAAKACVPLHERTLLEKKLPGFRPSSRLFSACASTAWRPLTTAWRTRRRVRRGDPRHPRRQGGRFHRLTETTIYKDTDLHEIAVLFDYLYELGVDGFMLSPAFGYVGEADPKTPRGCS